MGPTKVILQFMDGTSTTEIWRMVKTLQTAEVLKSPIVVGKFFYAAAIVDSEEDATALLRACERSRVRVEFRFE